jgi:ribosomal protein S18 acetylase RimI-like enzyme
MTADTPPTVRTATGADLEALTGLAAAFRDHLAHTTPSVDDLAIGLARLLADPETQFVLALDGGGRPLGYVQCRYRFSLWTGSPDVELEDVFVTPSARRRGVGEALVRFVLAEARRRGCRLACLAVNERNLPALSLYEGVGFSPARARWQGGRQLWLERPLEAG